MMEDTVYWVEVKGRQVRLTDLKESPRAAGACLEACKRRGGRSCKRIAMSQPASAGR